MVLVGCRTAEAVGDAGQADFVEAVESGEADVERCVVEECSEDYGMNAARVAEHIEVDVDGAEYFELSAAN